MNDNELRNRIADLLWRTDEKSWEDQAQTIIDEFGLTVETHAATHAKRNMTRITGAWEWNNQ